MIAKHLLWVCCLCALFTPTRGANCFLPNGTEITSDTLAPCISIKNETSMCCRTNDKNPDTCETNGLCWLSLSKSYFRNSCTDPTWKSPNCLRNICMDDSDGGSSTGNAQVQLCRDGEQLKWCCGSSDACCTDDKMFTLKDPLINIGGNASTTTTVTVFPTGATDRGGTSSSTKTEIGLGVGVPLGVLAIVMLGFGFWWGRRNAAAKYGALHNDYQMTAMPETDMHTESKPVHEIEATPTRPSELPVGRN